MCVMRSRGIRSSGTAFLFCFVFLIWREGDVILYMGTLLFDCMH